MKMKTTSLPVIVLCVVAGHFSANQGSARIVTMDFQNAPVGSFSFGSPLVIPDGVGGRFTLTPSGWYESGATYEIVNKSDDRELRVGDLGYIPGSFQIKIRHSEGDFTVMPGGDYEAIPGKERGNFWFSDEDGGVDSTSDPISTVIDTPFNVGTRSPVKYAMFEGNGMSSRRSDVLVDIDNLVFDVVHGPVILSSVSAVDIAAGFTPVGGEYGKGALTVVGAADVVVEGVDDLQTTYAGGSFEMTTWLLADNSAGGLAAGKFRGNGFAFRDSGGADLLTGDLDELLLYEVGNDMGMLAGSGLVEVTGGSLQADFRRTHGEIFQMFFHVTPPNIDNFASAFTGFTDITITPIPEPATMGMLVMGGLAGLRRRRRGCASNLNGERAG